MLKLLWGAGRGEAWRSGVERAALRIRDGARACKRRCDDEAGPQETHGRGLRQWTGGELFCTFDISIYCITFVSMYFALYL